MNKELTRREFITMTAATAGAYIGSIANPLTALGMGGGGMGGGGMGGGTSVINPPVGALFKDPRFAERQHNPRNRGIQRRTQGSHSQH